MKLITMEEIKRNVTITLFSFSLSVMIILFFLVAYLFKDLELKSLNALSSSVFSGPIINFSYNSQEFSQFQLEQLMTENQYGTIDVKSISVFGGKNSKVKYLSWNSKSKFDSFYLCDASYSRNVQSERDIYPFKININYNRCAFALEHSLAWGVVFFIVFIFIMLFFIFLNFSLKPIWNSIECSQKVLSSQGDSSCNGIEFLPILRLLELAMKNNENTRILEMDRVSRQILHDIKSPLATLKVLNRMILFTDEEHSEALAQVTRRIQAITNSLKFSLRKNIQHQELLSKNNQINFYNYSPIDTLESIILEKKIEYNEYKKLKISSLFEGKKILVQTLLGQSDFERIISNVINNSIRAMKNIGMVRVKARFDFSDPKSIRCFIEILDDGPGFSQKDLSFIGTQGYSHWNDKLDKGEGLGLFDAIEKLKSANGKILFKNNEINLGASVQIYFPVVLTEKINIADGFRFLSP